MKRIRLKFPPWIYRSQQVILTFLALSLLFSTSNAHENPHFGSASNAHKNPHFSYASDAHKHQHFSYASDAHKHPRRNLYKSEGSKFFEGIKTSSSHTDIYHIAELQEEALRFPDEPPPEPDDYRMNKYREIVPLTLKGGTVVNSKQAKELYEKKETLFIDVMPYIPKPPNLPKTMIWREKVRENIEGSHWLANVGYGALPPEMVMYFKSHLKKLTAANLSHPVLFYCQQQCWMSWNAAKRALEYGYNSVYWFPRGTDGWLEIGGDVIKATPVPLPNMTRRLTQ